MRYLSYFVEQASFDSEVCNYRVFGDDLGLTSKGACSYHCLQRPACTEFSFLPIGGSTGNGYCVLKTPSGGELTHYSQMKGWHQATMSERQCVKAI